MNAPQISEESLNAINLGMFWLKNRQENMSQWLSFDDWRKLNERINAYAPHLLVTISRRIPRLPQALGLAFDGPTAGEDLTIVTDLAIPWSAGRLKNLAQKFPRLKAAILDDSFSSGVTHGYVRDQLRALLPTKEIDCKCFVIAQEAAEEALPASAREATEEGAPKKEISDGSFEPFNREDVSAIHKLRPGKAGGEDSRETYSEFTRRMPRALMMLPKPFDIEYPVIKLKYREIDMAVEAEPWLEKIFGENNVHCLSTNFMENTGLARYSIDLAPGQGVNRKLRIFFDDALGECRIMAHAPGFLILSDYINRVREDILNDLPREIKQSSLGPEADLKMKLFSKEAETRLDFFMSSLTMGHLALKLFEDFLDVDDQDAPFSCRVARHLFGPDFEKYWHGIKLGGLREDVECAAKKYAPSYDGSLEATRRFIRAHNLRPGAPSPFWTSALKEGRCELLAEVREKVLSQGQDVKFQYFKEFFYVLADWAGNDAKGKIRLSGRGLDMDGFPSLEEFRHYAPLRRKVGPTFFDLLKIMGHLWARGETAPPMSPEQLHNEVSLYLDWCVDDGIVVPAISPGGERVYRKGESDAHNRDIARFYQLFKRGIEPGRFFDLADRESFKELSEKEVALMKRAIKTADTL